MPQFKYQGRDKEGRLRSGERDAISADSLSADLIKEGVFPIKIVLHENKLTFWDKAVDFVQGEGLYLEEMSIFSRQMQVLHQAGVPMVTALRQLAAYTHNHRLSQALLSLIDFLEKGQNLATAMQHNPDVFSPLMISIVQIGESTGHLSEAFGHLHKYLEFESNNVKQLKSAFRYPTFVFATIVFAVLTLNLFVIPTFSKFYSNLETTLPWQTRLLIGSSNFLLHYGVYVLGALILASIMLYRYLHTPQGRYRWDKLKLKMPLFGKLMRRIILIRFSQSFAIMLNSGISVTQALVLAKNVLQNAYIGTQISETLELIERGNTFTKSISQIDLFSPMELQILSVGEKNGELGSAMSYIGNFHSHEIQYDLKRMSDLIGPILISAVSVLILIIALGIYLPIWNMINLVH